MLTIERVAQYNRTALERHLKQNVLNQQPNFSSDELTFELAYNHSFGQNIEGGIDDLHEAIAEQLSENSISVFWRNINLLQDSGNPVSAAIAIILRDFLADLVVEYEGTSTLDQLPEIQQHVNKFNQLLKECNRLILFGHSQGAIVSNIAHTGIEPTLQSAIGVMGVGTPDSYVAGDGNFYINLEEDLLVQSIPGALPGNADNYDPFTPVPGVGHALIGNYIDLYSPLPSEEKIVDDLVAMIEQGQSFDNIDYCGWPAARARSQELWRVPSDLLENESGTPSSQQWNTVWEAIQHNLLVVQYRMGNSGSWTNVSLHQLDSNHATYMNMEDRVDVSPWIGFDNSVSSELEMGPYAVAINPVDSFNNIPLGVQQYRFIVNNKVIDQFTIDYSDILLDPAITTRPILVPLSPNSSPILPLY